MTVHIPVLLRETLQALQLRPGLRVIDGTLGGGGHSREILRRIAPDGWLLGVDRDPTAVARCSELFSAEIASKQLTVASGSYVDIPQILEQQRQPPVDRVLLDLGLSSDQLATEERGFSFKSSGPLDLRFDSTRGQPANDWLADVDEESLATVLHEYAEEPQSRQLARHLVQWRNSRPIRTAEQLASAVSAFDNRRSTADRHPATRIFQALRIVVNDELSHVQKFLEETATQSLVTGGIVVVISFHSLEDRLVKNAFREKLKWQVLTSKPVVASNAEQRLNPRSRSAKLRAAAKI